MLNRLRNLFPYLMPLAIVGGVVALVLFLFWLLNLLPPRTISMAAGSEGSGYYAVATQYREILAEDDITLEILETGGSVDNAALVAGGQADTAIIQGGVDLPTASRVRALAAIFLEPFFVFHRGEIVDASDPTTWGGLRVAAGGPGSGTRAAIESAAAALNLDLPDETLQPLGGRNAAEALMRDEVDAAVFVAPIEAPYLQELLIQPDIRIAAIRDVEALTRRLPYVRRVEIPRSGLNYAAHLPQTEIPLAAMVAVLAASPDLHPALVDRLVRAAERIHSGPNLLSATAAFPSDQGTSMPMNTQATAILQSPPSTIERFLPFWASAQISRIGLVLLPLVVLLLPLLRLLPGVYAWQMRTRVNRRYNELVAIDREADSDVAPARRAELLEQLDHMEEEIKSVSLPIAYRGYAYTLRLHIDLVRRKLKAGAVPA